ncbi:MAG: stage II sporulation protein M [Oscillospiraceae bacterium]|jgi:hypothetical protein|nr:stage II sporulation protein M [Oscillospiraceae bacterium]
MNYRIFSRRAPASPRTPTGLVLFSVLFAAGCVAGTAAAGAIVPTELLREHLLTRETAAFLPNFFAAARYPLAALFFAFSVLGVICIPALGAVRGFFLCFSISSIVRVFGAAGIPLALTLVLPGALFAVPCLFVLSSQAFTASAQLLKSVLSGAVKLAPPYGSGFLPRVAVCAAILAASALAETLWIPSLIAHFAARLAS